MEMKLPYQPGGTDSSSDPESDLPPRNITISTGGISICRPLLGFPKSNLVATCEANNVPFVTDKTNFDPTLTPRNAIRSLLAESRLPRALQPPSILSLIKSSQDLLRESTRLSNLLLRECKLQELNLKAGTMTVRFPGEMVLDAHVHATNGRDPTQRIRQIQALSLRRITEILSPFPENHFSLRGFEKFIDRVFDSTSQTQQQKQAFTLGGVLFKPLPQKGSNGRKNTWLVSRQPFMRHRLPALSFDIPIPSSSARSLANQNQNQNQSQNQNQNQDQNQDQNQEQNQEQNYTPWQLWDNRYWFRFALVPDQSLSPPQNTTPSSTSSSPRFPPSQTDTNATSNPTTTTTTKGELQSLSLTLRPLQQSDLEILRKFALTSPPPPTLSSTSTSTSPPHNTPTPPKQLPNKDNNKNTKSFLTALSRNAPAQTRFTLPVLVLGEQSHGRQIPLALPTLDTMCLDPREVQGWIGGGYCLRWEWMFKRIDGEVVGGMGCGGGGYLDNGRLMDR